MAAVLIVTLVGNLSFGAHEFSTYAGSASCQHCHPSEYNSWAASHHALAERTIDPSKDQRAFDPSRSLKHASQTSKTQTENGKFEIITLGFQTNVSPYRVERVIGVDPVRQFLTAAPGGRWQVHELSYDSDANNWFDVYGNEDRQPGEWGHWTGRGMNWNSRCAECHNTRLRKHYDAASDSYRTTMAEMGVGCEACHGPLKAHVEWRKAHPTGAEKDPTIPAFTPAQKMDTCGSCHARQDDLTGDFQPGDSFFDHYALQILDSTQRWYPDGQVHDEDYEFTSFLSSKMHESGVTCLDCHNPHSAKRRLPGNDLCMRCHNGSFVKAPVINPADHTHHQPAGKGGQCTGCHMPATVYMQQQERHDHGFTIPDPLLTRELGIPNACNRCHADKSPDWALEYANKWYSSKMQRHTRERAQWIAAAQNGSDGAREQMLTLLSNKSESPYWRAVAAGLLWRWADNPQATADLRASLTDPNPLVREQAARSLSELNSPEIIAALKPMLNDQSLNVRVEAAWALRATLDLQSRAGRDLQHSLDEDADQPRGQFRMATMLTSRGQDEQALQHLQKAVAWDPFSPPVHFELAELLSRLGRNAEAREAAKETLKLQPGFKPAEELLQKLSSRP